MSDTPKHSSEFELSTPVPERDASFALGWFKSVSGRDTLLKMGNAPEELVEPTFKGELATIEEFLTLEKEGKQKTWMIRSGDITIGAAWIDLVENNGVNVPSVRLMIGDPSYRGMGIGKAVMSAMIAYLREAGNDTIYSRHLASNDAVKKLNKSLGFTDDGPSYVDDNGLEWQNIKLSLEP